MTKNRQLPSPAGGRHLVPYGADTMAAHLDQLPESPYVTYLLSLSKGSLPTTKSTLGKISRLLYSCPPESAPWHLMTANQFNFIKAYLHQQELAPKTIHRHLCMVRSVLKLAKQRHLVPESHHGEFATIMETANVKGTQGRGEVAPHRSLSDDEIDTLFRMLAKDTSPAGRRDLAILSCMRGVGMRRMEVAKLSYEDIRWSDGSCGEICLRKTKGSKIRTAIMPHGLREILASWAAVRGDEPGPMFMAINKGGNLIRGNGEYKPLDVSSINRLMEKRLVLAGLDKATPHDLRYTFAQKNLRRSDLQTVCDLMGHSNISTTSIYLETSKEQMIAVIGQENVFDSFAG